MTYAVWAFPKKLILEREEEVFTVYQMLIDAKTKAAYNMEDIVRTCQTMLGGSLQFWRDYFVQFNYGLDQTTVTGLKKYLDLCFEQKLLASRPLLQFWPEE
jgi:chorismate dehydratase